MNLGQKSLFLFNTIFEKKKKKISGIVNVIVLHIESIVDILSEYLFHFYKFLNFLHFKIFFYRKN